MAALETARLTHVYPGGNAALQEVDFAVEEGEFVVLLGPNGSGKTTLFRHFTGLLKPTGGLVKVRGEDVQAVPRPRLYSIIGYLLQDPNDQIFAATVGEDVAFGPRNLGLAAEEVKARVRASLAAVGLCGLERQPVHALSFGQKRRVALAGMLAMHPSILVLDEPTSGLDPLGATRLLALLRQLNREKGATIVMATHDVDIVPGCAERVYVLRGGRIAAEGPPAAIFAQPEVLQQCELRPPRAAQALQVVGNDLGHALSDLPLTIDEAPARHKPETACRVSPEPGRGFTTGVAAAAAARAAAEVLFGGCPLPSVTLRSAAGAAIQIPVAAASRTSTGATATIVKEPSAENDPLGGAEICATVRWRAEPGIAIEGGPGVGTVTAPGLPVPVGEAAINPIPRQMIADAVGAVLPPGRGVEVVISVPGGEELARRTVNASRGIEGGVAILGTSTRPAPPLRPVRTHTAICFLGHGSRSADANESMYRVMDLIRQRSLYEIVEAGFMELSVPGIPDAVQACIDQGARRILLMPYFLHMGMHMKRDLPEMVEELQRQHPEVEIQLGPHIGFHPLLADILLDRIAAVEARHSGTEGGPDAS